MSEPTRVGVVQMTSNDEVDRNLDIAERLVRRGAAAGAQLLVLPECFAQLGREDEKLAITEPLPAGGPRQFIQIHVPYHCPRGDAGPA